MQPKKITTSKIVLYISWVVAIAYIYLVLNSKEAEKGDFAFMLSFADKQEQKPVRKAIITNLFISNKL